MAEESKDFTTFVTSKGLMRFKVMPFGMVNSGSTYNRMVRKLLEGAQDIEVTSMMYLDTPQIGTDIYRC